MMKEPSVLLSFIIPVYNVEKELFYSCMNSLKGQTYSDIEILIIDDGSKEEVATYCDDIAVSDSRISVIHKKNQGVSEARNTGTRIARGDYIFYVDSDDLLAPIAVEEGVLHLDNDNVDAVFSGMEKLSSHKDFSNTSELVDEFEVLHDGEYDELKRHLIAIDNPKFLRIKNGGYITRGPVCRLVKRSIANKILFPANIPIGEDLIWNMNLLKECKAITIVYNIWYGYLKLNNSAVRKYHGNRIECVEKYLDILYRENKNFCENNMDVFGKNVAVEFYCILKHELLSKECKLSESEKNKIVKEMLKREPWNFILKHETFAYLRIKYRLLIILSKLNVWQFVMKTMYGRDK